MKGRAQFAVALVLSLLLPLLAPIAHLSRGSAAENIDARIAAEERRRRELDKRVEDYRRKIREMGAKVDSLLGRIDVLEQDESMAAQGISVLELQQNKIHENIAILNAEMTREQVRINELSDRMQHRIVDLYKYGTSEEMNLFFSSENVFQAVEAVHMMQLIARHDEVLLSQLQFRYQNLDLSRRTMDEHRAQLKAQSQALREQKEKYHKTILATNSFVSQIQRQKKLAEKASREAEEAQKAVGQTILALMRRKQERSVQGGGRRGSGVDYLAGQGRGSMFDWPLRGPISSNFGLRIHPIFKTKNFHSGIDIAAPAGTSVKAAAAGEVLFVGWLRGYGQVVILDHGRNYSTVYAHLSSALVREGQVLRSGSALGKVGRTGTATGYHLHFEVRIGSTVKNPLDYLRR
ncbi:M23 family metallopeptidase [uncultured Fretibacterium sp.]|uniref:murein hydrolase activator EnvC family protein n=1 Tax=uncultured Fretibacterium sp. TaxID=1678694 RepID=UPI00262D8819|nr:M23 family metallopeptidase [uncultured Fretibacterium sp.]